MVGNDLSISPVLRLILWVERNVGSREGDEPICLDVALRIKR